MTTENTTSGAANSSHRWKFYRAGGVDQVMIRHGQDIANLQQLDQKLWMALAMPTRGVEFDPRTLDFIDTDKDGRIRPPEILAAVAWIKSAVKNLDDLTRGGDSVSLSSIQDQNPVGAGLLASARHMLSELGKAQATSISIADIADTNRVFAATKFNGDSIVPADSAEDAAVKKVIEEILATQGAVPDRSGKPGINQAKVEAFFAQAATHMEWHGKGQADPAVLPLGEATAAAAGAVKAIKGKIDDYFTRCRLAAFDSRAVVAVNRPEAEYLAASARELTAAAQELAAFPLARIEAARPLPLSQGLNPAFEGGVAALVAKAIHPLLGPGRTALTEDDWIALQAKLAPFEAWMAGRPATTVDKLGEARLRELLAGKSKDAITALIKRDAALETEFNQISAVEKLLLFQRDFVKLLNNYVTFGEFYSRKGSIFQSGTLYLDARGCNLCIEVADAGRHAALAGLAGAYLAYCDCTRMGGLKKSIVAVFTDGDSDNLIVGRNGVYYDRKGQDWDATITKIVANPISIREAFWAPYKKLARMIEEQVAKRAAAADADANARLAEVATATANLDKTKVAPKPNAPKPLDLGTIALIGSAIGGMSAAVGVVLKEFFNLGIWMPAGFLGVVILISGPSMLLAWLKLRKRNLGPILDANGWAINTVAKMNVPFGAALTNVASLPSGAERSLEDPYAEKKSPWKTYAVIAAIVVLGVSWYLGKLDSYLPGPAKSVSIMKEMAPAYQPSTNALPVKATGAGTNAAPAEVK